MTDWNGHHQPLAAARIALALAQGAFWAEANGCTPNPETHDDGRSTRSSYRCPVLPRAFEIDPANEENGCG